MAATLQSTLGDVVTLPDDLLPDDTRVIYDDDGIPINEVDSEDEIEAEWVHYDSYVDLALAYYNGINGTDYKVVKVREMRRTVSRHCGDHSPLVHCGFLAAPSRDVECESAAKHFCAEVQPYTKEVVSCCILDVVEPTSCQLCFDRDPKRNPDMVFCYDTSVRDEAVKRRDPWRGLPPLSQHSHYVADGVTLSDKAKCRLDFALLALVYFNKKQHMDYKLVDVLPSYTSIKICAVHGNFIARQSDASNELFFFEIVGRKSEWVVNACRVVRGKTTAGCHNCPYEGKRVIHPTHGFRFGLYPYRNLPPRSCCKHRGC